MGIPKFYRWISERYPLISQPIHEDSIIPEYDYLYLDFNGIIHRCSHPDDIDPLNNQLTEADMILKMFDYVQKIVQQIKPRKVLIIAVDGVAPRAKMNQQRSRRFRSAEETQEKLEEARKKGKDVPNQDELFDSNCITPGTSFMEKLNDHFEYFIRKKISEDETWKDLNVFFSGHDVPGEGEHKIMSFIRKMKSQDKIDEDDISEELDELFLSFREKTKGKNQPSNLKWDPNATHCMYGLDADLIMLSLVTHEPHFSLLRENALKQVKPGDLKVLSNQPRLNSKTSGKEDSFQLLHISILREYLHEEFKNCLDGCESFEYDFERIIDDFVFMCYFIGNDFLPNLPFLDISAEALNRMFSMYKNNLRSFGNYLTTNGTINGEACRKFLEYVSIIEKEVLGVTSFNVKDLLDDDDDEEVDEDDEDDGENNEDEKEKEKKVSEKVNSSKNNIKKEERALKQLQIQLATLGLSHNDVESQKLLFKEMNPDDVWKQGYYIQKFSKSLENTEFHDKLRFDYLQGLAWVLKYYYNGCQSWGWYYPYHYAPLASDLVSFNEFEKLDKFPPSEPFKPFQQLLGVLPIASKKLLPIEYQKLMTAKNSPLKEYFPLKFEVDQNGKKNPWEAVVIIPFIDEKILIDACNQLIDENRLSEKEKFRNRLNYNATWYFYDEEYSGMVLPTLPGIPTLENIPARKEIINLPNYETNFSICEGVLMGKNAPSHFPTLKTIKYHTKLKKVNISIFRGPSKRDTLVICIDKEKLWKIPSLKEYTEEEYGDNDDFFITEDEVMENEINFQRDLEIEKKEAIKITKELGEKYIGKIIFSRWPYHEECRVLEVCCKYTLINSENNESNLNLQWDKIEKSILNDYLVKRGIDLGPLQILFKVAPVIGMHKSTNGNIQKTFNEGYSYWQPYQVLVTNIENIDSRYIERNQSIEEEYPIDSSVVITNRKYCGGVGKILDYNIEKEECKVEFYFLPKLTNFPKKYHYNLQEISYSLDDISRGLNCSKRVLSQIAGKIWNPKLKFDVGLNIKSSSKNEKVVGYTLKKYNQWFFTQKGADLLVEYKQNFPEVFLYLQKAGDTSKITQNDLFPKDTKNRWKELKKWISSLNISSSLLRSASEEHMSLDAIKMVEKDLEDLCTKLKDAKNNRKPKIDFINRKDLEHPLQGRIMPSILNNASYSVGDFVSYLRSSSGPPFGSLAVVVAVDEASNQFDLVFGLQFIGGTDLNGRCSAYRGMRGVDKRYCIKLYSPPFRGSEKTAWKTDNPMLKSATKPLNYGSNLQSSSNKSNSDDKKYQQKQRNTNTSNSSNINSPKKNKIQSSNEQKPKVNSNEKKNISSTDTTKKKQQQQQKKKDNTKIKSKESKNISSSNEVSSLPSIEPHKVLSKPPEVKNINEQGTIDTKSLPPALQQLMGIPKSSKNVDSKEIPKLPEITANPSIPCQVPMGSVEFSQHASMSYQRGAPMPYPGGHPGWIQSGGMVYPPQQNPMNYKGGMVPPPVYHPSMHPQPGMVYPQRHPIHPQPNQKPIPVSNIEQKSNEAKKEEKEDKK